MFPLVTTTPKKEMEKEDEAFSFLVKRPCAPVALLPLAPMMRSKERWNKTFCQIVSHGSLVIIYLFVVLLVVRGASVGIRR